MYYQEFRPQQFKDVVGNTHIIKAVSNALFLSNLPHAYFFYGGRGTGKTSMARLIAKALNCKKPVINEKADIKFEPCLTCVSCKSVVLGNHTDLIEIDAASNRGVDNIRELRENVKLSSSGGKYKIYIIDEVHMLTNEAANALLKTLEEPPSHVYFVLCTTNPEKVVDTIKSRCIQYRFDSPSIEHLVTKLQKIVNEKKLSFSKEDLQKLAVMAKGAYRDAETLLEQYTNADSTNVLVDTDSNKVFLEYLVKKDLRSAIVLVNDIYKNKGNIELWLKNFLDYLRILILYKIKAEPVSSEIITKDEKELMDRINIKELAIVADRLKKALLEMNFVTYPTFSIEIALIDLLSISEDRIEDKIKVANLEVSNTIKHKKKETKEEVKEETIKKAASESKIEEDDIKVSIKTNEISIVDFPYSKLLDEIRNHHHSIFLVLKACSFDKFDGKNLYIKANYSFHKERVLSTKTRQMIECVAAKMLKTDVILNCDLGSNTKVAKSLTDRNVEVNKDVKDIEKVFESVFGDDFDKKA